MNSALKLGRSFRRPPHAAAVATALLVAGSLAASASAQDISPVFDMGLLTNTLSMDAVTQSERARAMRRGEVEPLASTKAGAARGAMSGALDGRPARAAAAPRFTYAPTPAVRRAAADGYVARIARQNPTAARQVAAQFARYDVGRIYQGLTAPIGLRDDDTADILTGYTVLGWLIATGAPDPSPGAVRAARNQIAASLAANPTLSAPATRAQLGEELKLLFVTLHAGWQPARQGGKVQSYSDGVAQMFKVQSGRDLRAVKLTEAGFGRR